MKSLTILGALFLLIGTGCATWQETTKDTLTVLKAATEAAEQSAMSHFQKKCQAAAVVDQAAGCDGSDFSRPECKTFADCLKQVETAKSVFIVIYENIRLTLIAITLGDQQTAMEYLGKALNMVKSVYKTLKALVPDKIPDIPFLGS